MGGSPGKGQVVLRDWWRRRRLRRIAAGLHAEAELSRLRAGLNAAGPPRGLTWRAVRGVGRPVWALRGADPAALQQVEVEFEAAGDESGEEMRDAPGLRTVRSGTVLWRWQDGGWASDDRVLMNLAPADVLSRYAGELAEWPAG